MKNPWVQVEVIVIILMIFKSLYMNILIYYHYQTEVSLSS